MASQQTISVYLADEGRVAPMALKASRLRRGGGGDARRLSSWEALKAQAVAARTRTYGRPKADARSMGADDICTDSAHCQGYATPDQCRELWGLGIHRLP